jgi:hypothetical protein
VNWHHFRAILWLRWRMRLNQLKKGGTAHVVIMAIWTLTALVASLGFFIVFLLVGIFGLADSSATVQMAVWDGLVAVFLFSWTAGVVAELQRTESLSLEKLLHLPMSLTGAFLINYLASLVSLSMIVFFPALAGLALGLVFSKGAIMLWLAPLLAAFMLMVTAITYQFQGWLASLMQNKRRRRTVIVIVTGSIILLGQAPNLINIYGPWRSRGDLTKYAEESTKVRQAFESGQITREENDRQQAEISDRSRISGEGRVLPDLQKLNRAMTTVRLVNAIFPPGWLPLGATNLAEGTVLPALLGTFGLTLIGLASLRRSYRTTVGLYTGRFTSGKPAVESSLLPLADQAPPDAKAASAPVRFLEMNLPGMSEHASAIALASFRSLLRAPETKLMLLTPVIMALVFGGMMVRNPSSITANFRPLVAFGAMAMILLGKSQLLGNQFGFDRNGFRVFILCPARRRDILLGKNLALAPLVLGLGLTLATLIQAATPMRIEHFLATLPQFVSMYFVFCLLGNCLSILAPAPVAAGALKMGVSRGWPMLFHLMFMFVFPAALAPMMVPLAIESILEDLHWLPGLPVCLFLSIAECIAVAYFYSFVLSLQGRWLQSREKKILETVTAKSE